MSDESDARVTTRLHGVLAAEADQVQPSPLALARIEQRLELSQPRRPGPRQLWSRLAVAVVVVGLVATLGIVVARGPWGRGAVPAPQGPPTTATAIDPTIPVSGEATTVLFYPSKAGTLIGEPTSRGTLEDVVARLGSRPADQTLTWAFKSMGLESVTERDGLVVVDYAVDDRAGRAHPDAESAQLWAQSLVHTIVAYLGHDVGVSVTLRGQPFQLFGHVDTTAPLTSQPVSEGMSVGVSASSFSGPDLSPTWVVGAVASQVGWVSATVTSRADGHVVAQFRPTLSQWRTFGFSFVVPKGRYEVRVVVEEGLPGTPETHTCTFENG